LTGTQTYTEFLITFTKEDYYVSTNREYPAQATGNAPHQLSGTKTTPIKVIGEALFVPDSRNWCGVDIAFVPVARPDGSYRPSEGRGSYRIAPEQVRTLREFVDRYHVNAIMVPRPTGIVKDPELQREKLHAWLKSWDRAAAE